MVSILLLSIPEFRGPDPLFPFGVLLRMAAIHRAIFAGAVHRTSPGSCCSTRCWSALGIFLSAWKHLLLPAVALGLAFSPTIMRVLRSSLFDVYHEDYIQQARLRGLSEGRILTGHALKNASLPTLTLAGVQFGFLFSGTLLVEVIYSYPAWAT